MRFLGMKPEIIALFCLINIGQKDILYVLQKVFLVGEFYLIPNQDILISYTKIINSKSR